jgi:hypothetical protein
MIVNAPIVLSLLAAVGLIVAFALAAQPAENSKSDLADGRVIRVTSTEHVAELHDNVDVEVQCFCRRSVSIDVLDEVDLASIIDDMSNRCEALLENNPIEGMCDALTGLLEREVGAYELPNAAVIRKDEIMDDITFAYEYTCATYADRLYYGDYRMEIYFDVMGIDISHFYGTNASDEWINGLGPVGRDSIFDCNATSALFTSADNSPDALWNDYMNSCQPSFCLVSSAHTSVSSFLPSATVLTVTVGAVLIVAFFFFAIWTAMECGGQSKGSGMTEM